MIHFYTHVFKDMKKEWTFAQKAEMKRKLKKNPISDA